MSYILDALQRADAERARGSVPTLNARPLSNPAATSRLATPQRVGMAIAGLVVVLVAAAWAWWTWGSGAPQHGVVVSGSSVAPAVVPAVASTVPVLPASVAAVVPIAPPAAPPPVMPSAALAPQPKTPAVEKMPMPTPAQTKPAVVPASPATQAPAPTSAQVPLLSELPEATRREIPALAISGAVYSENPAQRLLLVNGQVLNQGSEVAPELKVVEIRSNVSEFSFRGTRFRLAH